MRISDWSSDVCSSDLAVVAVCMGTAAWQGPGCLHGLFFIAAGHGAGGARGVCATLKQGADGGGSDCSIGRGACIVPHHVVLVGQRIGGVWVSAVFHHAERASAGAASSIGVRYDASCA